MSPEECRHEALKRLAESDELFEQWTAAGTASAVDDHTDRGTFDRVARQLLEAKTGPDPGRINFAEERTGVRHREVTQ